MMAQEPRYWILLPHPPGMPGHLFALLDWLQWRHPTVQQDLQRLQYQYQQRSSTVADPSQSTTKSVPSSAITSTSTSRRKHFCHLAPDAAADEYACPLGCPQTKLIGSTASGYGADAYNIYSKLRDGLLHNNPIQAFPTVLGPRLSPPCK